MSNGRLLDTNTIIKMMNVDVALTRTIALMQSVFIPVTVYGELMFGAEKSAKPEQNKLRLQAFCADFPMLAVTKEIADAYGKLKSDLQKIGKIIPENDMWIAAAALAFNLTVITGDKHFSNISELCIEPL